MPLRPAWTACTSLCSALCSALCCCLNLASIACHACLTFIQLAKFDCGAVLHRMASSRVQRSVLCFLLLLTAATSSSAQVPSASDYLAPIPAPANSPCEDTAPDCMDVCGCDDTGIELACRLSSPIGEYLRCADHRRPV